MPESNNLTFFIYPLDPALLVLYQILLIMNEQLIKQRLMDF